MFCNKCGNQLEDNAVFCAKCGNRVDGAPAPAQKPARPVAPKVTKPLFVLGLILWFGGAPISISYMGAMAMPGLLTHCGGTFCTVLAVIFYSLGILASLLPSAGGLIGNNLPETVKALLCKKTYIISIGSINKRQAAFITPVVTAICASIPEFCRYIRRFASLTERVLVLEKYITERKYSFQCQITERIRTETIATPDDGITILKNVPSALAPSIEAASSSSFGSPLKNCIYMNIIRPELKPTESSDGR